MANITCDVVRDLLPLYVDDVLSEDSRALVDEHIESCDDCRKQMENMRASNDAFSTKSVGDDRAAIKRIRSKLNRKRILTICITAAVVAALVMGLYYKVTVRESYVAYEDSGLYVEDNILKTSKDYHAYYGASSPDGSIEFMFLTTTKYDEFHSEIRNMKSIDILDLNQSAPSYIQDDNGKVTESGPAKAIYYLPEKYAEKVKSESTGSRDPLFEGDDTADQQIVGEMIAASTLVWKEK